MTDNDPQSSVPLNVISVNTGITRDLSAARDAYKSGDVEASRAAHSPKSPDASPVLAKEEHGGAGSEHLKSLVFGGLDGICTTFAVVAASAGANLSTKIILLMGFANLIGDGIAMGFGDYLSSKAETEYAKMEKKREEWELENFPEGEKKEMIELYTKKGMTPEDATAVMDIYSKYDKMFVDLMMFEELNLMPPGDENQAMGGLVMFLSFTAFGSVPLWFYVGFHAAGFTDKSVMFAISTAATGFTMFMLGAFKATFIHQPKIKSGFSMLLNGGLAAAAAYFIGWGLEVLISENGN